VVQIQEANMEKAARKKLEARRLAFDTSLTKKEKAKKDDFKLEEEYRQQQLKYDEFSKDVMNRIMDIQYGEAQSVKDLHAFLEAELAYHESCAQVLSSLRNNWPGGVSPSQRVPESPRHGRSRSNTASSFVTRIASIEEQAPAPPPRPTIARVRAESQRNDLPILSRTTSLRQEASSSRPESPTASPIRGYQRDYSPPESGRNSQTSLHNDGMYARTPLRLARGDESPIVRESGSFTPISRTGTDTYTGLGVVLKKAPPPPPPSRSKKPPPPPPMKRASYSSPVVPTASSQY
jgi:hypothetical protein